MTVAWNDIGVKRLVPRFERKRAAMKDLNDLRELKRQLEQQLQAQKPARGEPFMAMWQKLAGDRLDDMLSSQERAKSYLSHPSWKLRLAAISMLRAMWGPTPHLVKACETMAFEDLHSQVRDVALSTLAHCYRGTNDRRIAALLLQVVHDPALPNSFRDTAYQGLFDLRGVSVTTTPFPGKYRFPEDVNWSFVDSFDRSEGT